MIFEKVQGIIAEQLGKELEEITLETNFRDDLDADSLDLFQIVNDLEDEYDIKVEDPSALATVGDAVALIEAAVAQA